MLNNNINRDSLRDMVDSFQQGKVLVLGDLILDEFVWGEVSRISPEAPIPVVEVVEESFMPGGAANVGNNVCSLGGQAFLGGVIGHDSVGKVLKEELARCGMNIGGVIVDESRPTTLKTRIIAHHQQVVRVDREKKEPLADAVSFALLDYCRELTDEVNVIVIEDYGKGVVNRELLQLINGLEGKIVIVDPGVGDFSVYAGVDIITPNRHEAEMAFGKKLDGDENLYAGGKMLMDEFNFQAVLVTLGEEGMCLFQKEGDEVDHIPTVAREVYDVSGAGDTVVSTLALALSIGASLKEAAYLSNIAAGIVVGKTGTAVVSREDLYKILDEGGKGISR